MTGKNGDKNLSPEASVIIRCYNEAKHLPRLFEELKRQSHQNFEIVIVDSGSDDGTLDIVGQESVHLLHIPKEEFSFGRSLNLGCAAAKGEILVFISAHCYPTGPEWLGNLLDGFNDSKVAAVYGKQRGGPDTQFSEQQIFRQWFGEESVGRQSGPFSNNANCSIRRSLWEEFQYDEDLPGLEDTEWATRVIRHGWWVSYRADAAVVHIHDETPKQVRRRYQREAITLQQISSSEHFNAFDFIRLFTRNVVTDFRQARREAVLRKTWLSTIHFRFSQFLGTYQGFHTRWPASSDLKRKFYYPRDFR